MFFPSLMHDPPHVVRNDVVAPHHELDDGIGQHLFEGRFWTRDCHDLLVSGSGSRAPPMGDTPKHSRDGCRDSFSSPSPDALP